VAIEITDECVGCGACEDQCPNTAISLGATIFVIDPDRCTECVGFDEAPACATACPVDCCLPDPLRVETEAVLFERALVLHRGERIQPVLSDHTSHFRAG
jgi:ferredoxin